MAGTPLTLVGFVVDRGCEPVEGALVEFWHADDAGEYDNVGYRLRGHQFTDASGSYRLETITPGLYPGRTRHIHVKVQAPSQPVLTTQLYFPDEPDNGSDGIYNESLLMTMADENSAEFRFVLDLA
jgi:protocatechuate 3,4-dioxygenase beta subunit